jgi:hypothetical protein
MARILRLLHEGTGSALEQIIFMSEAYLKGRVTMIQQVCNTENNNLY